MSNPLTTVQLTKGTQYQVDIVNQVDKATQEMGQEFTEYGRACVINAMINLITFCKANDIKFELVDQTMVKGALINIGYTELNFAATPAEAFFDMRKMKIKQKDKSGEEKEVDGFSIVVRPQGAGNEKLTRRFGVNVQELKSCILVREGDEYTLPGFDGEKMTPFKWTPKSLDAKVIMVVYPLLKVDGTYEYLMATRESVKANLIAQIRQNTLYTFKKEMTNTKGGKYEVVDTEKREAFYEQVNAEFEKLKLDQILADPNWRKYINPTYTSGGSQEAMIIRKMKNNALKNYPREFSSSIVRKAVEDMYEDSDPSVLEKRNQNVVDVDPVEKVEQEINEEPKGDAVADFVVEKEYDVEVKEEKKQHEEQPIEESKEETKVEAKPKTNYDEEI